MAFDVIMLTSAHSATDDRIFYREAETLVQAGLSVCVVGKHARSEVLNGVCIQALKAAPNRARRLLLGMQLLRNALALQGRLFIIHDPELIGVALILRALGKRVLYDAHENLPAQVQQKDWIPTLGRWLLVPIVAATEWLAARLLSGVIAAVPAIYSRFPASRTVLVRNFPTQSALAILAEGPAISSRANVVIYTGTLSQLRGIGELVEAFRDLPNAELWLVGDFDDAAFQAQIISLLPRNALWLGWRAHPEVLRLYRMAKLGAVLLHPAPNHRCALPVKLFEYLGAGLPVVASDFPEYREFVEGCGALVDPKNVSQIRTAISRLLADDSLLSEMSTRARQRVLTTYSWQNEGARLHEFCMKTMTERWRSPGTMLARSSRHS